MSSLLVASIRNNWIYMLGNCFASHRPLAERIIGWICHKLDILLFYRLFSGSELLSYGNRAWFRYRFSLSNNDKESFSSTRDLTRRPNQAKCLLRGLTPTANKWTLHASWFPRKGDNRKGPGGSTSPWNYGSCWLEKKAAQPCLTSRRLNESLKLIKIILFPNIVH